MYVVTGVTGKIGSIVARILLRRGEPVRAVVRRSESLFRWKERGAQVVMADLYDIARMTDVLRGARAAFLLVPHEYHDPEPLQREFLLSRSLAEAVAKSGIPRVVLLSSFGAQHSSGTGLIRILREAEDLLIKTGVSVTCLRPAFFMENWVQSIPMVQKRHQLHTFFQPLDRPLNMVSVEDVGRHAVASLLNSRSNTRVVELSGPRMYSPLDVAEVFSGFFDKKIRAHAIPRPDWEEVLVQEGLSHAMAALIAEMFEGINKGIVTFSGRPETVRRGSVSLEMALGKLVA